MIRLHLFAVLAGCALDACFGDPRFLWHPVCAIGWLIAKLEAFLRCHFPKGEKGELKAGIWLVILVLTAAGAFSFGLLLAAYALSPMIGFGIEALMCGQMMAWRSLRTESMKVGKALMKGDIEGARTAVSMIVGRDTAALTDIGITKAAVETVAENTSDGILAPLFYMVLFGGVGIYLYKAVNTMDSMVGYKNDTYFWFGRAAARLDDFCNFIPARLSALLMLLAGYLCQLFYRKPGNCPYSGQNGLRIFIRDRFNHKSPNSAQTEAVCAGVLQIQLAGNAWYFGTLYEKPFIGDAIRPVEYRDIQRANCLMTTAYVLALLIVALCCIAA